MPELNPLKGRTAYKALTNLNSTHDQGTIADTPCTELQWVYAVKQDLDPGLHTWQVDIEILAADGETVLLSSALTLPILVTPGGGPFPAIWSVQNEKLVTSFPADIQTWQNQSQDPQVVPLNDGDLPAAFEVYSAHYLINLPAGALFRVTHHEIGSPDLRFAPILTSVLPGGGAKKDMRIDPVTGCEHFPMIENGMLVLRTQAYQGMTGITSGLTVSYAGGVATVAAGSALIGFKNCVLATDDAVSLGNGQYLFIEPVDDAGNLQAVARDYRSPVLHCCLGKTKGGSFVKCNGALIADPADSAAIDRQEDGRLVVRYDRGAATNLRAVSYNRGVTWVDG
jgi:hypothetical protein